MLSVVDKGLTPSHHTSTWSPNGPQVYIVGQVFLNMTLYTHRGMAGTRVRMSRCITYRQLYCDTIQIFQAGSSEDCARLQVNAETTITPDYLVAHLC